MNGKTLILTLLLATGVVLAGDEPASGAAAGAGDAEDGAAEKAGPPAGEEAKPVDESSATGGEKAAGKKQEGPKVISGMSILGNQEAPKSLVIVPWKSSVLGASIGFAPLLDDARQPVDKEVFMRALAYYEIRSGKQD